jgi:hypothetical protein
MSNLVLPRRLMPVASKHYGPEASKLRVKVYFHPTNPDGSRGRTNWATMEHREYFDWLKTAPAKGLVLESVEQIRNE